MDEGADGVITQPTILDSLPAPDRARIAALNAEHASISRNRIAEVTAQGNAIRRHGPTDVRLLVAPTSFADVQLTFQVQVLPRCFHL